MILNALVGYYERAEDVPREGWIRRGVDYVVVLDEQGECVNIETLGEQKNGKTTGRERLVPAIGKQGMKHNNSGKDANLLWDNASFVLGRGKRATSSWRASLRPSNNGWAILTTLASAQSNGFARSSKSTSEVPRRL